MVFLIMVIKNLLCIGIGGGTTESAGHSRHRGVRTVPTIYCQVSNIVYYKITNVSVYIFTKKNIIIFISTPDHRHSKINYKSIPIIEKLAQNPPPCDCMTLTE